MSRDTDKQCAVAMGYTVYHYDKDYAENCYYMLMDAQFDPVVPMLKRAGERKTEDEAWGDVPHFSDDDTAARLLEDEIERRKMGADYVLRLIAIATDSDLNADLAYWGRYDIWAVIRATPEQRARAFLEVIPCPSE